MCVIMRNSSLESTTAEQELGAEQVLSGWGMDGGAKQNFQSLRGHDSCQSHIACLSHAAISTDLIQLLVILALEKVFLFKTHPIQDQCVKQCFGS